MKRKVMLLLSVVLVVLAGCGNKKTDVATNVESTETVVEDTTETEKVSETEVTTESEEEQPEVTEADNKENQNAQSVNETSESNAPKQTESKTQTTSNNSDTQNLDSSSQQEPQPTEPTPQPEPQVISYSPQNVVALATAKTKAAGKVLLTENLDNLLANGQISQEEYNEYYPYDGAGYYSVFVDTNLAEARDVSGTENLNSEDKIAQYISDMLVLESGPYFLIEYAGTYDYYGKQCYEFRCYRA